MGLYDGQILGCANIALLTFSVDNFIQFEYKSFSCTLVRPLVPAVWLLAKRSKETFQYKVRVNKSIAITAVNQCGSNVIKSRSGRHMK